MLFIVDANAFTEGNMTWNPNNSNNRTENLTRKCLFIM
ncbi:hypothetical protein JOC70_003190 [Clostridium pascui]|nr:hypothetical protein [Clostridium pascui]